MNAENHPQKIGPIAARVFAAFWVSEISYCYWLFYCGSPSARQRKYATANKARAMVIHDRVLLAAEDRPAPGAFRSLKGAA